MRVIDNIKAIKANLNQSGFGVIDFMNTEYIIENLIPKNIKTVDGIAFNQKRYVKNGYVVKDISFTAEDKTYNFQERVKALSLKDFKILFKKADVTLLDVFGDYKLSTFERKNSERLIMIFK